MNQEAIPVIFCCDDRYLPHAACAIASIVHQSKRTYNFYLPNVGFSSENERKLKQWDLGQSTIHVIPFKKIPQLEQHDMTHCYYPNAGLYVPAIPLLFPELKRAIYLDSDVVVASDLGELWDIDLGDKLMGVVYEDPFYPKQSLAQRKQKMNFPAGKQYFNNGVMLMNLEAMRALDIPQKTIQVLENMPDLDFHEQDAQNIVLDSNQLLELNPGFNTPAIAHYAKRMARMYPPKCIHYIIYRPWNLYRWFVNLWPSFFCRCCRYYHKYLELTPWENEVRRSLKPYKFIKQTLHLAREWLQHKLSYLEERLLTR